MTRFVIMLAFVGFVGLEILAWSLVRRWIDKHSPIRDRRTETGQGATIEGEDDSGEGGAPKRLNRPILFQVPNRDVPTISLVGRRRARR